MGSLMSTSKSEKAKPNMKAQLTQQDKAILDLKASRDRLKKYQKAMETDSAKLLKQAMALNKAGKKDRAVLCMKMKRYKEKQVGQVDAQLLTVEEMVQTIQWETETMKVVEALQEGNKALDAIHSVMSVDKVEALMDETAEAIAVQQEIDGLLSGEDIAVDEGELEAELAAMEADLMGTAATATPQLPVMPAVPTQKPVVAHTEPALAVDPERVAVAS
mmetsp:Transcript_22536/g.52169  ORF Transcript_22536/g.52169 Transcript_22536/m.52169 type:complete len:218 (+) Transcript_22536:225-878(+)|eukprot:CAMPEP_0182568742 /NCGR_PEP_ID=MMETSP1324-20130603/9586_1 /TAXON_ID=236786 /ORGANISM="Florenciella sp., Strain RCC1587" /LENGTH=217 /DNA_ID=CAMNT_0024782923 /DNA_START=200 /DNA_END=853 /DNA_ORIENTATION=+